MARKRTAKPNQPTEKPDKPVEHHFTVAGIDLDQHTQECNTAIDESKGFWDGADYKLEAARKENEKYYLGNQAGENDDDGDPALDNRIFSSVRTIVPYVTTRITQPEVYPSSNSTAAKKFAEDLEKILFIKAEKEKVRQKIKFALEDAIIRRGGYLKPRYDATTGNFCSIEYVPCESIIVDHKAKSYEEPRYFRHVLDKTPEDLIQMFPDMKSKIYTAFGIDTGNERDALKKSHKINENWKFVVLEGKLDLIVSWSYKDKGFGCIKDPNWRYDDNNYLPQHMMPLIPLNVLSDGRTWVDRTTYVEQAKYSQVTIDKRSEQIGENAGLGSVGMPVVDSEALGEEQSEYLTYEKDTVLVLTVPEGKTVNDVFTKWQASSLPADVYKDKTDAISAVQNAFGASAIQQGNQTDNNTLGQDQLLRDQSMGRQQEIVDAIDQATNRLYMFIAQFLLVYGSDQEIFRYVGENSQFDSIIMHTDSLDTDAEIRVKSGTSMPIDNPQRRATADKAAGQAMIDPLSYWEIMDEPNSQKYAKRLTDWTNDPASFMKDVMEEVFSREAYTDVELIKRGQQPDYRDNLDDEYFAYLNQFMLDGNLESPELKPDTALALSGFIQMQLARGQKQLGMKETQLPTADDVAAHNQQVDEANAAAAGQPEPAADPNAPVQPESKPGQAAKPAATPIAEAV